MKQSLRQRRCTRTLSTPCRYFMLFVCYQSENCHLVPYKITPLRSRNRNKSSALSSRTPSPIPPIPMLSTLQSHYRIRLTPSSALSSLKGYSIITTSKAFLHDSSGQNALPDQRMLLMLAQMGMFLQFTDEKVMNQHLLAFWNIHELNNTLHISGVLKRSNWEGPCIWGLDKHRQRFRDEGSALL